MEHAICIVLKTGVAPFFQGISKIIFSSEICIFRIKRYEHLFGLE
jgi:hypothetical protein